MYGTHSHKQLTLTSSPSFCTINMYWQLSVCPLCIHYFTFHREVTGSKVPRTIKVKLSNFDIHLRVQIVASITAADFKLFYKSIIIAADAQIPGTMVPRTPDS